MVAVFLAVSACSDRSLDAGIDEPIRVRDAQFVDGELPGSRPPKGADASKNPKPWVISAGPTAGYPTVMVGMAGWPLQGTVSADATAIGLRIADAGSGYWQFPVTTLSDDLVNYGWRAVADIGSTLTPGYHDVEFTSFTASGTPGTVFAAPICFQSQVPDNLNACDPTIAPPYLVVSLSWDAPVDLDLRLVAPDGKVPDGKHPTTSVAGSGSVNPRALGVGVLDRDVGAGCVFSGPNREDVVFQTKPPPGTYFVYVNLFDACGRPSAIYDVELYEQTPGSEPGTYSFAPVIEPVSGSALAVEANPSSALGTFVTEFVVK
jgi:hypothetical protein